MTASDKVRVRIKGRSFGQKAGRLVTLEKAHAEHLIANGLATRVGADKKSDKD